MATNGSQSRELLLPYRYVTAAGDIDTEHHRIHVDRTRRTATLELALSGWSKSELLIKLPADLQRDVPYLPELTRQELHRRLPELAFIEDNDLREQVVKVLLADCPDHYWTYPASTSGRHHPIDERGLHGQWIHTKRVAAAVEDLSESMLATSRNGDEEFGLAPEEHEYALAATFLHDIFKFGSTEAPVQRTLADHDVRAARHVRTRYDFPDPVANCIDAHNGPWKEGKAPGTPLELLVHFADMAVASPRVETLVKEPTAELRLSRLSMELEQLEPVHVKQLRVEQP